MSNKENELSDPSLQSSRCANRSTGRHKSGCEHSPGYPSLAFLLSTFYLLPLPSQSCSWSCLVPFSVYTFLASLLSFIFVARNLKLVPVVGWKGKDISSTELFYRAAEKQGELPCHFSPLVEVCAQHRGCHLPAFKVGCWMSTLEGGGDSPLRNVLFFTFWAL